jgi:hypothetical protein
LKFYHSNPDVSNILLQDSSIKEKARLTKDEAKLLAQKSRTPNVSEKCRQQMRQTQHENRYKVVNCHRALESDEQSASSPKEITIVDMEQQTENAESDSTVPAQQITSTHQAFPPTDDSGAEDEFVYDLYVPDVNQQLPSNIDFRDAYMRLVFRVDSNYYI